MSSSFQVVIRADAGGLTGTGHVMRMMALAQALNQRGGSVTFAVVECPDGLRNRLIREGFGLEILAGCELGSAEDCHQLLALAARLGASWIGLDGYAFRKDYQAACQAKGYRVLCVDDHEYEDSWSVDALLNQNLHAPQRRDHYKSVAGDAALWLGTDFALLRNEFWRRATVKPKAEGEPLHVLVTMGGADPPNATTLILEALALLPHVEVRTSVLVGASNPHRSSIDALVAKHPGRFEIISAVERMSDLLELMDGVITAGGSTCWELLWACKPGAVLVIAENQQPIADSLDQSGLMVSLGNVIGQGASELAARLEKWLSTCAQPSPSNSVDGKGALRVAAALEGRYSITIATAGEGWLRPHLEQLKTTFEAQGHRVVLASKPDEMLGGDFLFLLSYWGIVSPSVLNRYLHSLVVHASNLPNGRGWSPATWSILDGCTRLPVCLLEASDKVDRGDIYYRDEVELCGDELIEEWRELIVRKTAELCLKFVANFPKVLDSRERQPEEGTYFPRRGPADSKLDPSKTLEQLFNQLRVVDNTVYPAFFDLNGHRYILRIEKQSV